MFREGPAAPHEKTPSVRFAAAWIAFGVAGVVTGVVLTVAAWRSASLLSPEAYNTTVTVHEALGPCAIGAWLVLLHGAVRAERPGPPYPMIAWVIASLVGLGVTCVWASPRLPDVPRLDPLQQLGQLALFVAGGAVTVHTVKSLRVVHPWERWVPLAVAGVATSGIALSLAPAFAGLAPVMGAVCVEALLVATLTALIDVGAYRTQSVSVLPMLLLALSARVLLPGADPPAAWLTIAYFVAGIAFAIACVGALPRTGPPSVRWLGGVTVVCFVEVVLLRALLASVVTDAHRRDRFVVTATVHAAIFTGILGLAALHARRSNGPSEAPRGATLALVAMAVGLQGALGAWFALGVQGRPVRYVAYLPRFTTLHRIAAVASVLFVVGAAGWIASFRTRGSTR